MCPVLLIAISAWAIAQVLKLLISIAVYRKFDLTYLTTGGGMPSSHSALVCATAVSTAICTGFDSPVFAVATVLAFMFGWRPENRPRCSTSSCEAGARASRRPLRRI